MSELKLKTPQDNSVKTIPPPLSTETKSTTPETKTVEDAPRPREEQAP